MHTPVNITELCCKRTCWQEQGWSRISPTALAHVSTNAEKAWKARIKGQGGRA